MTLEGYGYAWLMADIAGHSIVFHTGDNAGFQSINATLPDDNAGFIALTNDTATDLLGTALSLLALAVEEAAEVVVMTCAHRSTLGRNGPSLARVALLLSSFSGSGVHGRDLAVARPGAAPLHHRSGRGEHCAARSVVVGDLRLGDDPRLRTDRGHQVDDVALPEGRGLSRAREGRRAAVRGARRW